MSIYLKVKRGGTRPPDAFQPDLSVTFVDDTGFEAEVKFTSILALDEAATTLTNMRDEAYRAAWNRHDHYRTAELEDGDGRAADRFPYDRFLVDEDRAYDAWRQEQTDELVRDECPEVA